MNAPDAELRASTRPDGMVRMRTRDLTFDAQGSSGAVASASHASALELLLAALAADLVAGFARAARRAGVSLHDAELRLSARLENPLMALGVVGETGSPALASVTGTLYVSCDATAAVLPPLWASTLARSPLHATLTRAASLDIALEVLH